ncbi:MAG: RNA polymerase sigma-70 factor [Bacteroidales bacterium]|nr:RNA polymerase sigma-70 factor [Bacteroidales bacterium]
MKHNEKEILTKLKHGDDQSLKYLFTEYYKPLYVFARKYLAIKEIAEEIVQDVFIYLWDNIQSIDIQISLKSYLFTSVKNRSLNYIKSRYNQTTHIGLEEVTEGDAHISEISGIEYQELYKLIQSAIENLPEKCKEVFYLSRNSEFTYQEIADDLGISKDTVKMHIKNALKKIKIYLKDYIK